MHKILLIIFLVIFFIPVQAGDKENNETGYSVNQTSASLLVNYAKTLIQQAKPEDKAAAEKKHLLMVDIYIKARSYAILNKTFFFLSVAAGLLVLLWPSLSIIFKSKLTHWEWVKSATVQTTVTGIAALMFTFYSQYKDKQTYAETLMRHVIYSEIKVATLSVTVADELARIDRGFSFNSILSSESDNTKK